jgi:hypothetical protein
MMSRNWWVFSSPMAHGISAANRFRSGWWGNRLVAAGVFRPAILWVVGVCGAKTCLYWLAASSMTCVDAIWSRGMFQKG